MWTNLCEIELTVTVKWLHDAFRVKSEWDR